MSQLSSPLERALLLGAKSSAIDSTTELKAILEDRFRVEIFPVEETALTNPNRTRASRAAPEPRRCFHSRP